MIYSGGRIVRECQVIKNPQHTRSPSELRPFISPSSLTRTAIQLRNIFSLSYIQTSTTYRLSTQVLYAFKIIQKNNENAPSILENLVPGVH
jgi:hypothetical protein